MFAAPALSTPGSYTLKVIPVTVGTPGQPLEISFEIIDGAVNGNSALNKPISLALHPNEVTQGKVTLRPDFGSQATQKGMIQVSNLKGEVLDTFPVAGNESILLDINKFVGNELLIVTLIGENNEIVSRRLVVRQ
ncbi:MAG: hypothetical protein HC880_21510 [Bacteroidia bacterium]|nr:hypothetical protein [Bacteroidia bacterium]